MKVAVIGGGWAGIAAAVELTAAGINTTLFEAGRVLGGRARSISVDGQRLDNGQHILLGAYAETLALMQQIGADPESCFIRQPLAVIDNAGFRMVLPKWPAPLNVAWGLLTASGVSLSEKITTAWWMQQVKWQKFQLASDCTVAEWLDAAGQTGQLRRHLWEPLCLAALNIPAKRASAQIFANVLRDSLGSPLRTATDLLLPTVDLGWLIPEPAAQWLQKNGATLRLGTRIDTLNAQPERVELDGEAFAAVIIATAPQHAGKLWPEMAVHYDFEPIATVYLQFEAKTKLDFPLINLLGQYGQWVVDRGNGLLACVLSGHGDWESLDDASLADALRQELGIAAAPRWQKVVREKRATFACAPNTPRPSARTSNPRVWLAGDYTWAEYPATLEGAVRSGRYAARQICLAG